MVAEKPERGGSWACGLGSISTWEGVLVRPDTVAGLLSEVGHPSISNGHHQSWQDAAGLGSSISLPRSSQYKALEEGRAKCESGSSAD